MRAISIALALMLAACAATAQTLHDRFDARPLDARKWMTRQIKPDQILPLAPGRCGAGAVSIVVKDSDGGSDCSEGETCQRAEVRTVKSAWPPYGEEVWFAFSFRISGSVPERGSDRTVIGQWKAPGDSSPFVAQRFDDGVFHITVQDNGTRRVVASAAGNMHRILTAQQLLGELDPQDSRVVRGITGLSSVYALRRQYPKLATGFLPRRLEDALEDETSASPETGELAASLNLPPRVVTAFGDMSFVAEPERYLGPASVQIKPEEGRLLPDPRKGWVDMVYRIRGGRRDNEVGPRMDGEVEVWANGLKIVTVTGNLGYKLRRDEPIELLGPYFKFGWYRKKVPGTVEFQFDEFVQARSRAELPVLCSTP